MRLFTLLSTRWSSRTADLPVLRARRRTPNYLTLPFASPKNKNIAYMGDIFIIMILIFLMPHRYGNGCQEVVSSIGADFSKPGSNT
jgi:hypothetical protein